MAAYSLAHGWEQVPADVLHGDVADVAVGPDDAVYLITRREPQVLVYSLAGQLLRSFGAGTFSERPHSITVGPDGSVWCVDETRHTVLHFTNEGRPLGRLGEPGVASESGMDPGLPGLSDRIASISRGAPPFNLPTKVAVALGGDLYVSDGYGNARIHRFSPEGHLLASWGEPGDGPGQFHVPHHVLVTDEEEVFVCDRENERIQVFDLSGRYLRELGPLQRPAALAFSPDGLLFVAELPWRAGDRSFRRGVLSADESACVTVLDRDGRVLERWSDNDPCSEGGFTAPHGIAFDSRGDLYVAEVTWSFAVRLGLVPQTCPTIRKFVRT